MQRNERIQLRKLETYDLDFMVKLASDPEVARFIPGLIEDAGMMAMWADSLNDDEHEYVILLNETGEPVGECSLTVTKDSAEIGLMIKSECWGKGYGTEAIQRLMLIAQTLGIYKLIALTDTRNEAMRHTLEKLGFQKKAQGWLLWTDEADDQAEPAQQTMIQYEKMISP